MRTTLGKSQYRTPIARVNSARDAAFLQHAAYSGSDVEGYSIDKSLSNQKGTVYVNKKTGKVTVAFAGTEFGTSQGQSKIQKRYMDFQNAYRSKHGLATIKPPTPGRTSVKQTLRDIGADIHIATGTEESSSEFKNADNQYQSVIKKYGKENVDVTGHSLGGAKAAYLSQKYGVHAETFNQGASIFGTEHWDLRNVDAHVTTGDVVPVGVHSLKQGTGIKVHHYHQNVVNIIKDEIKKGVKHLVEGATTKKAWKSGLKDLVEPGSSADAAIEYGEGKVGEAAVAYEGVKEAAKIENRLHSSGQFVPTGRTDAATQSEKPPDSKPIPAPAPTPKAGPSAPTPAPAPTPPPPSTPTAPSVTQNVMSGYHSRYHLGYGGV